MQAASGTTPESARSTLPCRLADAGRGRLAEALREHPLVHVTAPGLRPEELIALASGLGTIELPPRAEFRLTGHPSIMRIGNVRGPGVEKLAGSAVSYGWHSDLSYRAAPPAYTLLYAVDVPRRGGDTWFVDLRRLHDELDPATAAAWETLEVEHENRSDYFDASPDRRNVHPLVGRHPDSGRRVVFASPWYARRVLGVSDDVSRAILDRIAGSVDAPHVVHRWSPGDLLVWDNRAVIHRATEHEPSERRLLWRVSLRLDRAPAPGLVAPSSSA